MCPHKADLLRRGWSEFVIAGAYSDPSRSASFGACLPCKMEVHDDPHLTGYSGAVPSHCAAMVGRPGATGRSDVQDVGCATMPVKH